jgi:pimeloyl-ACP methyl ester carboxylesterase
MNAWFNDDLRRLISREARAYLRSGWLAPTGPDRVRRCDGQGRLGALFVSGVGANASQFADLMESLEGACDWFDAFEYTSLAHPQRIARALAEHIETASSKCDRIIAIGHSLGGLLLRMVLQSETPPEKIAGFVSICAPLHGTFRARLAPNPFLRQLAPDGPIVTELLSTTHRLERLRGATLAIGARWDQFVTPYESAFIDGHDRLLLDDAGHVAALFDSRVHAAIVELARRISDGDEPELARAQSR